VLLLREQHRENNPNYAFYYGNTTEKIETPSPLLEMLSPEDATDN